VVEHTHQVTQEARAMDNLIGQSKTVQGTEIGTRESRSAQNLITNPTMKHT